jgi:cytochrome c1
MSNVGPHGEKEECFCEAAEGLHGRARNAQLSAVNEMHARFGAIYCVWGNPDRSKYSVFALGYARCHSIKSDI